MMFWGPSSPAAVAPTITSSATFSSAENQSDIGTVIATGSGTMVYSIVGGADQALMSINSSSGALTWLAPRNFEAANSAASSNAYAVQVQAANGVSPAATMSITVNLTNVDDVVPIVTASQSFDIDEDAADNAVVGTVLVTAGDSSTDGFEITGGNTGTVFAISSAGVVSKIEDLDYGTLSSYTLAVRAHNDAGWSSSVNVGIAVNEAAAPAAWPSAQSFTPYAASTSSALAMPAVRTPTVDPKYTQTTLTRITAAADMEAPSSGPVQNNFGPIYADQQIWNADQSLMLISAGVVGASGLPLPDYVNTNLHLYNGTTGAYVRKCQDGVGRGLPPTARWSQSDADELLFVETGSMAAAIQKWKPSTQEFSVVKDFSATYDQISPDWTGGVNEPDITGRYWALGLRKPTAQWYVVVWDRDTDTVICEIPTSFAMGPNPSQSVTLSRTGAFVVVSTADDWTSGATSISKGICIFDATDGSYLRSLYHGAGGPSGDTSGATSVIGHHTLAQNPAGDDVFVYLYGSDGTQANRWIKSIKLDGTQSMPGQDECDAGIIAGLHYIGGYAFDKTGWVIVSDSPIEDYSSVNDYPMRGQIWALKLDGTKTIYPIAQSFYSKEDFSASQYYWIPWATPNRDFTAVCYKSSFDLDWSDGAPDPVVAVVARPA